MIFSYITYVAVEIRSEWFHKEAKPFVILLRYWVKYSFSIDGTATNYPNDD